MLEDHGSWLGVRLSEPRTGKYVDPLISDEHYRFLGFQMVGDVIFKYAAWLDATQFAAAGADVYLYHLDIDGRGDIFINDTSCCGLGHAKELTYT